MKHSEFKINKIFYCNNKKWLCTDIGTRTILAICLSEQIITKVKNNYKETKTIYENEIISDKWLNGPPYALEEVCFNEYDFESCDLNN